MAQKAKKTMVPQPNKQRNYACNTGSLPHYSIFEHDNILAMGRLVKSTLLLLEMDKHETLFVLSFGSFYSVMLPLWVTGVVLLADHVGRLSY
jgi:hypothetical protein